MDIQLEKKKGFSKEAYSLCSRWCFFLDFWWDGLFSVITLRH